MAQESSYYLMITALTSASNSCNSETSGGQKHVRSKAPGWESSPMAKGQIKMRMVNAKLREVQDSALMPGAAKR